MGTQRPWGAPSLLPDIRHPVLLLGDPDTLSVRGYSRAGGKEDLSASSRVSRRKTSQPDNLRKSGSVHLETWRSLDHWANVDRKFPEGHPNEKKEIGAHNKSQLENQTEEIQFQLLEKINTGGFYDLKRLFLSHDPEGRGRVTRDALLVVLTMFLGRFISRMQFQHLLSRLRLDEKPIITFDHFYDHFKLEENKNPPDWLDPMKRKYKAAVKTAHEVHLELKDMANHRYFELLKLFPKDSLTSSEFHSSLSKLGVRMAEEEFQKLWQRYVREDSGILGIEDLRCHLGAKSAQDVYEDRSTLLSGLQKVSQSHREQKMSTGVGSRSRNERKLSLSIEKWLKERFREGVRAMMAEFLVCDPERTHKVSREDFLKVLDKFQLHLTGEQLGHFLARCGLDENSSDVDYVDFLQRTQTRRKSGRTHKILSKENRSAHRRSVNSASTTRALEEKLLHYFHADFSALLDEFRKADTNNLGVISQQDFRGILERRFYIKVTDEEFAYLLERIPVDHHGAIRYLDFMAKFNSRDENLSLWGGNKTILTNCSQKSKKVSKVGDKGKSDKAQVRNVEQLTGVIKNLVKNNYEFLERNFNEMDPMNTRRMTAESLYQLLKRCGIHPEMSREEVGKVWRTLIQNQDQTVDYFQFVRHFGFSIKSSCFLNAKISPPVRGDGDCLIRSLKLNSDTKIIANFLQTKVKLLLPDLRRQFQELDPQNSGCVTKEEFLDILQELSPDLTIHQCDTLAAKFGHGPDKISYVKFLQPYQTETSTIRQNGAKVKPVTPPRGPIDQSLNEISFKLRQKLSSVDWRNLLQTCQKLDTHGWGYLLLPEFRSMVKLCNIILDEDDIYHIMSHYDKDLAGKINYSRLVSDHKRREG